MSTLSYTPVIERSRWSTVDSFIKWIVIFFGVLGAIVLLIGPRFLIPFEDATILYQFSHNLAHTGAITYYPYGPHAEGATDFGWMILLAIGIKFGIAPFWFSAVTNVASLFLIGVLLLRIAGARVTALGLFFIAGALVLMPQFYAAAVGFSVLPFACLLTLLTYFFLRQHNIYTPLVALIVCLFRPDGVVFAIPLLIAALIIYPNRPRRFALDLALFALPGVLYFLWRWHYFGQLLPLPFMVKANEPYRFAHLFVPDSMRNGRLYCLFAVAPLWLVLRNRLGDARNRAVLLCLVVLPNLFYFSMRLDQHFGGRFFIFFPAGIAILIAMNWQRVQPQAHHLIRLTLVVWLLFMARLWIPSPMEIWRRQHDNRRAIAEDLGKLPHGTMIVTEAGIVPYYSQWTAYDAWGLNTARFTRKLFQPSDVTIINPDVMLVYLDTGTTKECTLQPGWQVPYTDRSWQHLTRNIVAGIPRPGYDLWLLPVRNSQFRQWKHLKTWQGDQECWFIRHDSSLRPAIEGVLADHSGIPDEQYQALVLPPLTAPRPLGKKVGHRGPLQLAKAVMLRLWHSLDNE